MLAVSFGEGDIAQALRFPEVGGGTCPFSPTLHCLDGRMGVPLVFPGNEQYVPH